MSAEQGLLNDYCLMSANVFPCRPPSVFFSPPLAPQPLAEATLQVKHIPLVAIVDIDAAFPKATKYTEVGVGVAYSV
jgi:hypothetical protein